MTIYKLRDGETNEEFLEFDEEIIFQTACPSCLNIKSCLNAGHNLVDWRPTFSSGRVAGTPVSGSSGASPLPVSASPASPPKSAGRRGARSSKSSREGVSEGTTPMSGRRGRARGKGKAAGAVAEEVAENDAAEVGGTPRQVS